MCNDTGGESGEWDLLKTKFAVVPYWIQLKATDSRNKKFKLRVSSHDFSLNITHMTHEFLMKNSRSQLSQLRMHLCPTAPGEVPGELARTKG